MPATFMILTSETRLDRPNEVIPFSHHPVRTYAMYLASGLGIGLYALSVMRRDSLEVCAIAPSANAKVAAKRRTELRKLVAASCINRRIPLLHFTGKKRSTLRK